MFLILIQNKSTTDPKPRSHVTTDPTITPTERTTRFLTFQMFL